MSRANLFIFKAFGHALVFEKHEYNIGNDISYIQFVKKSDFGWLYLHKQYL